MSLIDTHTHLESFAAAGTLEPALTRARAAGLTALITIGTSTDDWPLYHTLAQKNPGFIHHTIGLHPCSVDERWPEQLASLETFWSQSHTTPPVALGECGLDRFHLPKDDPAQAEQIYRWQRAAFAAQLASARRLHCPLVIHSRGAFQDCIQMIDASGVDWTKVVFHCFTEGPDEIAELNRRGARGSFTGVLTYKNADPIRAAARAQGLDRFMLETDAPYLTPAPHRGKPNEPAYLRHTADFAATVFGISPEDLARISTANARQFFGL